MRTKLSTLSVLIILLLSISLNASSKTYLKLNFKKGSIYEVTTVLNNKTVKKKFADETRVEQNMTTGLSFKVLNILPNKNFLIEYSIQKIKMNLKIGEQSTSYDSESNNGNNPMNSTLKTLPNIKMELSPLGKIISMESFKFDSLVGDPEVFQLLSNLLGNGNMGSFISQMFTYFPEKKVEKGDKWTNSVKLAILMSLETKMNFELVDIEKNQLSLKITSEVDIDKQIEPEGTNANMKITGTQTGSMTVNPSDGWLRSYDLNQKFKMNMKFIDPKTKEDTDIPLFSVSDLKFTVVKK